MIVMADVLKREPCLVLRNTLAYCNYQCQGNERDRKKDNYRRFRHFHGDRSFSILPEASQAVVC